MSTILDDAKKSLEDAQALAARHPGKVLAGTAVVGAVVGAHIATTKIGLLVAAGVGVVMAAGVGAGVGMAVGRKLLDSVAEYIPANK